MVAILYGYCIPFSGINKNQPFKRVFENAFNSTY